MGCGAEQEEESELHTSSPSAADVPFLETVSVSMTPGSSQSTTSPLPVSTKIQRKNAKKSEAKKAAKAADEADRQRRLAVHKRDIEK